MDYEPLSAKYDPAISMIKRFRGKGFSLVKVSSDIGGIALAKKYPNNHVHLLIIDDNSINFVYGFKGQLNEES